MKINYKTKSHKEPDTTDFSFLKKFKKLGGGQNPPSFPHGK